MMAENEEDLAELSRLLYVAATRAADYLILSAGVEEPGKAAGPWMELIGRRFDLLSGRAANSRRRLQSPVGVSRWFLQDQSNFCRAGDPSKPVDLRQRRDLMKIVEKARQMADDGAGRRPRYLAPVSHDASARRQYSFSR